jgi:hypothetical protein
MKGFVFRLAIGAGAVVLVATGSSAQEGVAVKNLLGSIGIIPKDPPKINYRERAPLVLPPNAELRAPVEVRAVEARAANWPRDPDVMATRKEAAEAALPEILTERYKLDKGDRLSIDEMRAGRRVAGGRGQHYYGDRRDDKSRLAPEELKLPQEEEAKLDPKSLDRRYLSDPPQALLQAAAGAPLKASQDRKSLLDPESPYAFQRQQSGQAQE